MKSYIAPIVFSVGLLMMTFVMGFELIIFNEGYFEWHYENRGVLETSQMSLEDLMEVTTQMLDYLKGDRPNLDMQATIDGQESEVFGQREKDHMIDVQLLYLGARNMRRIGSLMVFGLGIFAWFFSKEMLYAIVKRLKYSVGTIMVFVLILGALFATDFEKYFTIFHELFFSNELWILDPRTDILINMVPYSYFYSIVMIGVTLFIVMVVVALILAEIVKKPLARRIGMDQ